ncbi:DUF4397 domain-containing protein [Inquilinus sp. KBS0705]|nr:DUF4397 domain-containing protein [Inquilinus sp. KBS0705]
MTNKSKSSVLLYLCLFIIGVMVIPMASSCGKSDITTSTNSNAQLQILNLSPDLQAFNLYALYSKFNTNQYTYPVPSGYFSVPVIDTPFQIRPVPTSTTISLTNIQTLSQQLQPHVRYSWFITGLKADSSITTILTVDTGSIPAVGRGKIRFVNASPNSTGLNLTANDTLAFSKVTYKKVTDYREVTAGDYTLKFSKSSAPTTVLKSLDVTILDGKLYTVFSYGLVNRADTAAFGGGILLNTVPETTTQ